MARLGMKDLHMLALAVAIALGLWSEADAQNRPRLRAHDATEAQTVALQAATKRLQGAKVEITQRGSKRIITSNGVPDHAVGRFPNAGNPNRISAQRYRFEVPTQPSLGAARALGRGASFGVAINGVPFDPNAAEFWKGKPRLGWQYNALGGAVALGLDASYGHVQPTGAYHYHGLPVGLMQNLGWSAHCLLYTSDAADD